MKDQFDKLSRTVENAVGSAWAFLVACGIIAAWAAIGPLVGWSDTWQLVVNTGTTIVTFLMVFVMQHTQTRDTRALHLKLAELIRVSDARNSLISAEDLDEVSLDAAKSQVQNLTTP